MPWRSCVLALGLLLAACGGRAAGLSEDEYRARADTICNEAIAQSDAALEPVVAEAAADLGEEPYSTDQLRSFYTALKPGVAESSAILREMFAALRSLAPPASREADYGALWDEMEAILEQATARIERATVDAGEAQALWDEEDGPFEDLNSRAAELGLARCALR